MQRRTLRAALLIIVSANLGAGLLISVLSLRHAADQARQTRISLAQLGSDAAVLSGQVAACGIPGSGGAACVNGLKAATTSMQTSMDRVSALLDQHAEDDGAAQIRALRSAIESWPPLPPDLATLADIHYSAFQARAAATRSHTWLTRLDRVIASASDQEAARAHRNSELADVETVLVGVTALAVAVTLFRGVDQARRGAQLRALSERARTEARFRALVTHASDVILVVGEDGRIGFRSPAADRLLRLPGPELSDVLVPSERQAFLAVMRSLIDAQPGEDYAIRHTAAWLGRDGSAVWIEASLTDLRSNPDVGGIVINGHDVTQARELQEQLRHQAFTDPLTGLANRALFSDRLEQALIVGRRGPPTAAAHALLFIDLDEFKQVNDTDGHQAGDEVLKRVASALSSTARAGDTVARLGGDEFAVLIHDVDSAGHPPEGLKAVAERMLQAVRSAGARASAGVAIADDLVLDGDDLVRRADLAMYSAKGRGGDALVVFQAELHSQALARAQLRGDLAAAVENDELRVLYQPVISLIDGRMAGAEALLRWEHPERGTISPAVFVPAAEESQDIVPFGRWVLRQACRQLSEWQRHHGEPGMIFGMAVNVSVLQLRDPDLVDDVRAALDDAALPASALTLEVTESQFIEDGDAVVEVLQQLRALGCLVAIDDFGTGYSSLAYLERLPADILKIDRSFVERIVTSREVQVLVEGVVSMAQALGMEIIAEGVEEPEQAQLLAHLGVRLAQGYLWAMPLTPSQIEDRMIAGEHRRNRQEILVLDGV